VQAFIQSKSQRSERVKISNYLVINQALIFPQTDGKKQINSKKANDRIPHNNHNKNPSLLCKTSTKEAGEKCNQSLTEKLMSDKFARNQIIKSYDEEKTQTTHSTS